MIGATGANVTRSDIAGIVFGALRGARRAAATLPDPDPAVLIDTAFAIAEHGAATHFLPRGEPDA